MQYDVSSPADYYQALEDDWRKEKLMELKRIILQQGNDVEESINYKMLRFSVNGTTLFHLNAQSGYVSLYVGNTKKVDPSGELLAGLNIGKGCIRFSKTKDVASKNMQMFIRKAYELVKVGEDIDC